MKKMELELRGSTDCSINTKKQKKWSNEFIQGLEELSVEETNGITGGESLSYWFGYAIGAIGHIIS
jgi:hypothetical protein